MCIGWSKRLKLFLLIFLFLFACRSICPLLLLVTLDLCVTYLSIWHITQCFLSTSNIHTIQMWIDFKFVLVFLANLMGRLYAINSYFNGVNTRVNESTSKVCEIKEREIRQKLECCHELTHSTYSRVNILLLLFLSIGLNDVQMILLLLLPKLPLYCLIINQNLYKIPNENNVAHRKCVCVHSKNGFGPHLVHYFLLWFKKYGIKNKNWALTLAVE